MFLNKEHGNCQDGMDIRFKLTKSESLKLLLVCALPVHFWAILMVFKEAETMLYKRDLIYGLGFSGYLLGLAILESLLFFAFIYLLILLFPKRWQGKTIYLTAIGIALVIAFWALANRLYFFFLEPSPAWFEWIRIRVYYRQALIHPLIWILVILSAGMPVLLIPRLRRVQNFVDTLAEKLIVLAPLYLFFDILGLVFTIARNLT